MLFHKYEFFLLPLAFETLEPGSLLGFLLLVSHPFPGGTEPKLALLPYVGEGPGLGGGEHRGEGGNIS